MPRVPQTTVDQWRNHMPYCVHIREGGPVLFNREYQIIHGESNLESPRLRPDTFLYTDSTEPWRRICNRREYFKKLHELVGDIRFSEHQIID